MQRLNIVIIVAGAILLFTAISFFASSYGGRVDNNASITPSPDNSTVINNSIMLVGIPDVRMSADATGGAAALQAVLSYWGIDKSELELIELMNGSAHTDIMNASKDVGLLSSIKTNLTSSELYDAVDRNIPVIIAVNDTGRSDRYLVVIGIDDENVYLEDPKILGSRAIIPYNEFSRVWRLSGTDNMTYIHPGIFIIGESPAQYSKYVTIV